MYPSEYHPLWFHKAGKTQTATGYGSKLTTALKVFHSGKWRRLYACCWGTTASHYVMIKGNAVTILSWEINEPEP